MASRYENKRRRTFSTYGGGPSKKTKNSDGKKLGGAQSTSVRRKKHATPKTNGTANGDSLDGTEGVRLLRTRHPGPVHSEDEGNSADESWEPGSRFSNTRRQGRSTQQHREAAHDLQCTDYFMDSFFKDIHVPFCSENPPLQCTRFHIHSDACVASTKRIVASNVTQDDLITYGGWKHFIKAADLPQPTEPSTNTVGRIYRDIILKASPIPWSAKPFKMPPQGKDGTYKLTKDDKPDREIRQSWSWFLGRLLGNPLKIPLEWTESDPSIPSERPEMPEAFAELLRIKIPAREGTPTPNSSLDPTPVKKTAVKLDLPSGEGAIKPLRLSTILEQPEAFSPQLEPEHGDPTILDASERPIERSTPSSSPLSLPYFELYSTRALDAVGVTTETRDALSQSAKLSDPLPPLQLAQDGKGEPRSDSSGPPPEPRFKLAYSLIKKHGLKETKVDALRLEQYLAEFQRRFDINQAKEVLCKYLGPIGEDKGTDSGRGFVFVPKTEIEKADKLERSGNAAKTEDAIDIQDTAMELNIRWVKFTGINEKNLGGNRPISELSVERKAGILFVGLFRFDELQESANTATRFINHLQLFRTSPRPDHAVRPAPETWPHWPNSLCPVIASGDTKTPETLSRDSEAQIALNTRPLLILEILMYLDTRQTANEPLPGWMFNFSWIYDHLGVIIYIHYPTIELSRDGTDWSWKMVTLRLTTEFHDLWVPGATSKKRRAEAKAAFDMIVTHTNHVLDQVRNWSSSRGQYGEGSIMNQLIARAHLDEGDYQWMYERVKEQRAKSKQQNAV